MDSRGHLKLGFDVAGSVCIFFMCEYNVDLAENLDPFNKIAVTLQLQRQTILTSIFIAS
jgi:hypothetical protein